MTIEFRCPECSKLLRTADDKAGLQANCPGCGNVVTVPADGSGPVPSFEAAPPPPPVPRAAPARPSDRFDSAFGGADDDEGPAAGSRSGETRSPDRPCPMCGERIPVAVKKCRFCGEDFSQQAPATTGGRLEPAGFWLRFAAVIIDNLITSAVMTPLGCIVGIVVGVASRGELGKEAEVAMQVLLYLFNITASCLYEAWMVSSKYRGTLGKMAVGIVVVDVNGEPLTFLRAAARFLLKTFLGLFTCTIGWIMAGFTERKQALHDLCVGSLVVKK